MSFLKRSVLAISALISILAASLVVFVLATAWGISHERDRILQAAHDEVQQAIGRNAAAVSMALWTYDTASLQALLQGMVRVGAITRLTLSDGKSVLADVQRPRSERPGADPEGNTDTRQWSVAVQAPDGSMQIGTLVVRESSAEVDRHIQSALGTLLISELLKIVGLTAILFVIVYRQIARHLSQLAADVTEIRPNDLQARLALQRRRRRRPDELDTLVSAINGFLQNRADEMRRRSAAEDHLRERMSEIETVLGALADGVLTLDPQCRVRYANAAAKTLLGHLRTPLEGQSLDEVLSVVNERTGQCMDGLCHSVVRDSQAIHLRGHVRIRTCDGSEFDARISAVPVPDSAEVSMILVFTDISAEISNERKIEFQAFHDPLTALGNRSLMARDLALAIERARREGGQLAVLCVDLDNFKNINDALGHTVGDILLKELAGRLRNAVQAPAWITRHGGDEFIIVVPQLGSANQAVDVAQLLMNRIAQPFDIEGHELRVTSSIGICLYPDHGVSIGELISNADMAMYEAKREGRNAYRFYEHSLLYRSSERLEMENGLRVGLDQRQFSLALQPKVRLRDRRTHSLEALLRWRNSQGQSVPPGVFIPVAEASGLIIEIGDWVLREALATAQRLRDALGRPIAVAANVSAIQFRSDRLLDTLRELAAQEPDLGQLLEIELTESALAGDMKEVHTKLRCMRDLGLKITIDDFGTGYSSLAYLRNLPINILKIDRAFIGELHTNPQDRAIVGSIVQLGKSLGFSIVAEGVEEQAQVGILEDSGCDEIQGYWFSRPVPEAEILKWLSAE